eukprot:TRINITY_DN5612_c0_g6_i1.p1 TRINITY_DN5612_c0_g6~~TRINITY_DN5612_c0_g6_i1.p1  ORF type:complete len:175 (+),score=18.03 TRINITY_DN5612_c0_g6_i1:137-661(+)
MGSKISSMLSGSAEFHNDSMFMLSIQDKSKHSNNGIEELNKKMGKGLIKCLKTNTYRTGTGNVFACFCEERKEVVLECGHSFCIGCFAQIMDRQFTRRKTLTHEKAYPQESIIYFDNEGYEGNKYMCSKCLAYTQICTLSLHIAKLILSCGCVPDDPGNFTYSIKNKEQYGNYF